MPSRATIAGGPAAWLTWLVGGPTVNPEVQRQRRLLVATSFTLAAFAAFFAAQRFTVDGWSPTLIVLLVAALLMGGTPFLIRLTGSHQVAVLVLLLGGLGVVGATAFVNGGLNAPALLFCIIAPLISTFVAGVRAGFLMTLLAVVLFGCLYVLHNMGFPFVDPPAPSLAQERVTSLVGLTVFAFVTVLFFERERVRAQAALARSHEDFRRLIETAPDAVAVLDEDVVVYANPALARLFGVVSPTLVVGQSALELIHPEDRAEQGPVLRELIDDGDDLRREVRLRRTDGSHVTIDLRRVEGVAFGGKKVVMLVGRDVTAERALASQLRLSDRMASVGSLAAGVAHEVNNPLTYVLSNLDFCVEVYDGSDPEAREALVEALDGARRVKRIVADLQSFSRERTEAPRWIDLAAVLEKALKMASHEIRLRAQVTQDVPSDLPPVWVDEPRLAQALLNLVVNAAQAMPVGAADQHHLTVRAGVAGGSVFVEIADTGSGIPDDVIDQVFDPFFTTKPVGEGTGLGLAITHNLITAMGGSVSLRNNPGRGATARVLLPRSDGAAALPPQEGSAPDSASLPGCRILVVDDEPGIRRSLRRTLREAEVTVATGGREALDLLASQTFDVILCDLMMPDLSGMDLFAEVTKRWPHLCPRFVFITGGAFSNDARSFVAELDNPLVRKPFTEDEIRSELRAACRAERDRSGLRPLTCVAGAAE